MLYLNLRVLRFVVSPTLANPLSIFWWKLGPNIVVDFASNFYPQLQFICVDAVRHQEKYGSQASPVGRGSRASSWTNKPVT